MTMASSSFGTEGARAEGGGIGAMWMSSATADPASGKSVPPARRLGDHERRGGGGEGLPGLAQSLAKPSQIGTFHQLEGQVVGPAFLAEVEGLDQVGVRQRAGGASLVLEEGDEVPLLVEDGQD